MSEARFLIIAAVLHGALPVAAFVAPASVIDDPVTPIEVAIEIEVPETRPPAPEVEAPRVAPAESTRETPARTEERTPGPRNVERPSSVEPGPLPTSAPSVEPAPTSPGPAPKGTSEYDGPPPAVPNGGTGPLVVGGGLPGIGNQAWSIPGVVPDMGKPAPAPTVAPKPTVDPQIATKVIGDAMKEKDKALGLDLPGSGTVATSVREAVQATDTPPESRATFEVRLSPTGQVLGVRVASSSGGSSEAWARAAKIAQASLAGRALTMTAAYSKGAVIYVNVQSLLTLPDGSKSAIERKGAGASFDVTSINARPKRVVRSSFSVVAVK
jgi:hypothetical protein